MNDLTLDILIEKKRQTILELEREVYLLITLRSDKEKNRYKLGSFGGDLQEIMNQK